MTYDGSSPTPNPQQPQRQPEAGGYHSDQQPAQGDHNGQQPQSGQSQQASYDQQAQAEQNQYGQQAQQSQFGQQSQQTQYDQRSQQDQFGQQSQQAQSGQPQYGEQSQQAQFGQPIESMGYGQYGQQSQYGQQGQQPQQSQYGQQVPGNQAQYYPFGGPEPQGSQGSGRPQRPSRFKSHLRFYWQDGGPVITAVITVVCVAVWLLELYGYYLNPTLYGKMIGNGAFMPALVSRKPWIFVTSMFLHATNVTHVLFNMLTLWSVGPVLERMLGHWRYLALYLLSGIGGGVGLLISALIRPEGWIVSAVGASGAIFGLFGAILVVYRRSGTDIRSMLVFVAINLAMPFFISGIAWQDHIGGFVTGGLVTLLLISGLGFLRGKTLTARMWISGLLVGLVLLVITVFCLGQNPINGVLLPF
ncbi:hypothetical protein KIM372_00510 [Bombiscardovia nodaiensis]|uniref:Peptidase S54 rhomboid domain-containing protein n=1 Tax=Bombiscardovia nodaiensis TaxID=2932181 RepID=A0ABM8B5M8_9BIFI|nr:hypothetical protein KIM372_00510 [Bombiscardovia nodaiensis]